MTVGNTDRGIFVMELHVTPFRKFHFRMTKAGKALKNLFFC
jgi:hypothetical protein